MTAQPERIVCACYGKPIEEGQLVRAFSEWRGEDGWRIIARYDDGEEEDIDGAFAHCDGCGAHLSRPDEDPAHPEPHAGPSVAQLGQSNAELEAQLKLFRDSFAGHWQDLAEEAIDAGKVLRHELSVRDRALTGIREFAKTEGWSLALEVLEDNARREQEEVPPC